MGSAERQGELWGAKARDWAEVQEPAWAAVFDRVLDLAGVGAGTRPLDTGGLDAEIGFADLERAVRAVSSAGVAARAERAAGAEAVRRALERELVKHLRPDGRAVFANRLVWMRATGAPLTGRPA